MRYIYRLTVTLKGGSFVEAYYLSEQLARDSYRITHSRLPQEEHPPFKIDRLELHEFADHL